MWVFDATPLIHLGKADCLEYLQRLQRNCVTPERVYDEVVTAGVEQGYPDARRVERQVERGVLETVSLTEQELVEQLRDNPNVSDTDATVLALADELDATAVMDDNYGWEVADTEGIPTRGTAYVILSLVKAGEVEAEDARATVDTMIDGGWYCSTELYATIVGKLDSLS